MAHSLQNNYHKNQTHKLKVQNQNPIEKPNQTENKKSIKTNHKLIGKVSVVKE